MSIDDDLEATGNATPAPASGERRRPARIENASPALIPLLRAPSAIADGELRPALESDFRLELEQPGDQLSAARGIAVGLALSLLMWSLIAGCMWLVLG